MRTNLLQRLKPEFKKGFENNRTTFPDMIVSLEHLLGQHLFYNDLTVNQITRIFRFADVSDYDRSTWNWRFGEDMFTKCNEVC